MLEDPNAGRLACLEQSPRQPRRIHESHGLVRGCAEVARRVDAGAHAFAVEEINRLAVARSALRSLPEFADLIILDRHGDLA
ncbi:unannotated protein [freshwater metagenome]|uniref:Unannotated protein n=1 Tax=freshwater metagenome TaxID=449393 RepID=A0A6J7DSG1_9ZZZZ